LVIQFCENHFVDSYYPTIENTFTKTIKYRGNGKQKRKRESEIYF
jgi:Ras family protein